MGTLPLPLPSGRASRRSRAVDRIRALLAGLRGSLGLRRSQDLGDKADGQIARTGTRRENSPNSDVDRR
jgi:hypothetical protein